MDINNAFDIITGRAERILREKGYTRIETEDSEEELTAVYVNENAYGIVYTFSNKRIVLKSCAVEDDEPDGKWKILATWLFDPESDTAKEAESIGDDFAETIRGPKQTAAIQKQKKRKKDGENNVDPLFLANRMVTYFPELKDEIAFEKTHYEEFRGITFADEKIAPRFSKMIEQSSGKKLEKVSAGLAALYSAGDLDTKGIITYVLLNSVDDDEKFNALIESFSDADKKIARAARNLRGKKIKAEKPQKTRSYISDTLNNM
ncbi:MAG: hypothetical protein IJ192_04915 [Clostridia bacterium]|nr:hypothetical protein [Clostridia bacterium]